MKEFINAQRLEVILQEVSDFIPPASPIVRARNVVLAHVRKETILRQLMIERPARPVFIVFKSLFNPVNLSLKRKYMPIIALILAIMVGGGGTVAAAQNDNPGDALYGVKLVSEAVVSAATPAGEAKIKNEAKLAERRSAEIAALKEKFANAQEQKDEKQKARVAAQLEATTERLEARLEQLNKTIAALEQKGNEQSLEIATTLAVKAELIKNILASIEEQGEVGPMLKAHVSRAQVSLAQFKAKAEVTEEEILKRHASEQGLEQSARGRVGAVSNKLEAVTRLRARILAQIEAITDAELKAKMQAEFAERDKLYQDATALVTSGREALTRGEWKVALEAATDAFKLLIRFTSPLGHQVHNAGALSEGLKDLKQEMREARSAAHKAEKETDRARKAAEQAFQGAFKELARLQHRAAKAGVELSAALLTKAETFMREAKAAYGERKYDEAVRLVGEARKVFAELSAQIPAVSSEGAESPASAQATNTETPAGFDVRLRQVLANARETLQNLQERKALLEGQGHTFSDDVALQLKTAGDLLTEAERLRDEGKLRESNEARAGALPILAKMKSVIKVAMEKTNE